MFEQRKASLLSGKENAFVAYKDLKKEVENSAHCFTLEQEVTDMITSTLSTSTLSSVLNCLGEDLYACEEVTNTFPLVLKKKKKSMDEEGFTPWVIYCILMMISHRYKYLPGPMSQRQKLREFN